MNKIMEKQEGLTKEMKELYLIYIATIRKKQSFTVNQINEVFKNDSKKWFTHLKTSLSTSIHGFLSAHFIQNIGGLDYIKRYKNVDNHWEYSIDLEDEGVKSQVISKIDSFLELLDLEYTFDENNKTPYQVVPHCEEFPIDQEKVMELWVFRDETTESVFEAALTIDQFAQLYPERY